MYVLEFRKEKQIGRNKNSQIRSFEDFEFLMREKIKLEKLGNKCLVYKICNNGKSVTRLVDKDKYVEVTNFDKEYRKGWKMYVNIRDRLVKRGIRDFYVDNDILYIKDNNDILEVEMVRKTPRYELRKNGKTLYDTITSQNDLADILFTKKGTIKKRLGMEVRY